MIEDGNDSESTDISGTTRQEVTLDDFYFESHLGSGQHGQVLLISLKANPAERFAMKVVEKQHITF